MTMGVSATRPSQPTYTADEAMEDLARLAGVEAAMDDLLKYGLPATTTQINNSAGDAALLILGAVQKAKLEIKERLKDAET